MRKIHPAVILVSLAALLLSACGQAKASASNTVQGYFTALVAKDANRLSTLSCGEWEPKALLELDSFQAVATRLEGLTCKEIGTDGKTILVNCQGKIVATYNNEDQEFDLSVRTYQVIQQGGEYLVCGYR